MNEQPHAAGERIAFSAEELRRLIGPLVVEQLLAITVGLADSVMVAGVSNAAVSAVSLVDSVSNLLIYVFSAVATGGAVAAGQYLGRRDRKNACRAAEQMTVLLGVLSVAVMALLYLGKGFVLHTVFGKIDAEVMWNTDRYYSIVMASVPFIALYNAGAALFRTMERSDVTFRVSLLMNAVNIGGNAVLIYGFGMGVVGAAIPTLFSRITAAAVILLLLRKKTLTISLGGLRHYRYDGHLAKNILSIGIPNGIENGMFHFGRLILTSLISSYGTAAIMANAIGNTIGNYQIFSGSAIGLGLTTVASQCVGAGDYGRAREYTRKLLTVEYVVQGVINLGIFLAIPLVLRIYHVSGETAVLTRAVLLIHGGAAIVLHPTAFTLSNTLRSAGDARFTMTVSTLSMWLCRVILGYAAGTLLGWGVVGVYAAHALDWVFRSGAFLLRYRGEKWESKALQ